MIRYHWVKRPWHDAVGGLLVAGLAVCILVMSLVL